MTPILAGTASYTDAQPLGLPIQAVHLTELRSALNQARGALGLPAVSFGLPSAVAGNGIEREHVETIRGGVR